MTFEQIIKLNKWQLYGNTLSNAFNNSIQNKAIDTISQIDINYVIINFTRGGKRSKLAYCIRNGSGNAFLINLIDVLPITHDQFRSILKCIILGNNISWIEEWISKNKEIKLNSTDIKLLSSIGYIKIIEDSENITQSTFETFLKMINSLTQILELSIK